MKNLRVTIMQFPVYWENIEKNLKFFSNKLDSFRGKTDLVVFPEMFTTGFTMNVKEFSEDMKGKAAEFVIKYAKKLNAVVCGSVIIKSGGKYNNRLLAGMPDGKIYCYDKRHLFRMAKEHTVFSKGSKQLILNIKGWRVAFYVCYDLRFPVWSRNTGNYDAAVFSANWPMERNYYWKTLLLARAIENQCYIIGANRTGTDKNGFKFSGDSAIINPMGRYVLNAKNKSGVYTGELDMELLVNFREKFPVHMDADKFKIF
ncbi:MAG: amidohydrolase [Ignavibacteriae bacterium]|nr:amidohydrolase [Ignavibacteriota bacterium]